MAIIFFIVLGLSAKYFDSGSWGNTPSNTTAASVLGFGSAVVGFGLGWSSLAADYSVNFPEEWVLSQNNRVDDMADSYQASRLSECSFGHTLD
jgi:purine-cytosine permease-like protein